MRTKVQRVSALAMLMVVVICGCVSSPPMTPPPPPPPSPRYCAVCSQEVHPATDPPVLAGKCFTVHAGAWCFTCQAILGPGGRCPGSHAFSAGKPCDFCQAPRGADGECANDHAGARPLVTQRYFESLRRLRATYDQTQRMRGTVVMQPSCSTCGMALIGGRCTVGHLDQRTYGAQPPPPNPNGPCPVCGIAMLGGRCNMAHTRQPGVNAPCAVCRTPLANDGRCYVDHSTLCTYCRAIKTQEERLSGRCRSCGQGSTPPCSVCGAITTLYGGRCPRGH